ncbi:MAG TPA: hypothetical protein VEL75_12550, partial [Candidatus Methylomirabilis sp.]|nr:hypothetical protein [Candidatus Methylomirabilis sp.]
TLPSGVVTTQTFYDAREQNTMSVTQVDLSALQSKAPSWFQAGGVLSNGVLYVANSSGGPTSTCPQGTRTSANPCPAVRLVNGSSLPANGLTVVSQNPVYIQGDYNTALTGNTSLTGPNSHPPAAVLADAVTVLSNAWQDSNSTKAVSSRNASNTTVNAAVATGPSNESTSSNGGNGQLENDIRFLENWSGITMTYSGSIVDLWHSEQVTAPWQNTVQAGNANGYYNAPTRAWSYDTLFNRATPPGTPKGVVMFRGQWSQK